MQSPFMTVDELAAYLKRPKSYIYRLTMKQEIPTCTTDRRKVFHIDQINAWLASKSKPAKSTPVLSKFQSARERLRIVQEQVK